MMINVSRSQDAYFRLARRASLQSNLKYKVGSVLVSGGRVLNTGCNRSGYSRVIAGSGFYSIHAEIDVILGFDLDILRNCAIFNYRETRDGKQALSRPCELCQHKLAELGIAKVYYTDRIGYGVLCPERSLVKQQK